MDLKLFQLLDKTRTGELNEADVRLLENVVREHPSFPMPYIILAIHHTQAGAPYAEEWKLKSAALVPDRRVLQALFKGNGIAESASPLAEPVLKREHILPEITELDDKTSVRLPVDEKTDPDELPADEIWAEEKKDETEVIPAPEQEIIHAEKSNSAEQKAEEKPPVQKPQPGINWYLNTFVRLRTTRYTHLFAKLATEISVHSEHLGKAIEARIIPPSTIEHSSKPKTELPHADPGLKEKNEGLPKEKSYSKEETPLAKTRDEKKETPVSSPQKAELKTGPLPDLKKAVEPETHKDAFDKESPVPEYQIGSFAGFSFLDSGENVPVISDQDEEGMDEGLIIEENDRVLEVKVTPEQLDRYFGIKTSKGGTEAQKPKKEEVEKIVSDFLKNDPRITPPEQYQLKNLKIGEGSDTPDENLVSETLAQIHAKQGRIARATKIYEKLMLLYPAKKDYFASQILNLKRK